MIVQVSKFTFYRMMRAKVLDERKVTCEGAKKHFFEINILPSQFYDYAGPLGRVEMEHTINQVINNNQAFFKKALANCKDTNS